MLSRVGATVLTIYFVSLPGITPILRDEAKNAPSQSAYSSSRINKISLFIVLYLDIFDLCGFPVSVKYFYIIGNSVFRLYKNRIVDTALGFPCSDTYSGKSEAIPGCEKVYA